MHASSFTEVNPQVRCIDNWNLKNEIKTDLVEKQTLCIARWKYKLRHITKKVENISVKDL